MATGLRRTMENPPGRPATPTHAPPEPRQLLRPPGPVMVRRSARRGGKAAGAIRIRAGQRPGRVQPGRCACIFRWSERVWAEGVEMAVTYLQVLTTVDSRDAADQV